MAGSLFASWTDSKSKYACESPCFHVTQPLPPNRCPLSSLDHNIAGSLFKGRHAYMLINANLRPDVYSPGL